MGRLIDADELKIKIYQNKQTVINEALVECIDSQPTFYDLYKVVEQLEELRKECEDPLQDYDPNYFIDKAIEIVKGGGV